MSNSEVMDCSLVLKDEQSENSRVLVIYRVPKDRTHVGIKSWWRQVKVPAGYRDERGHGVV